MLAIYLAVRTSSSLITTAEYKYAAQVLEAALQSANFVSHPSLPTLQALVGKLVLPLLLHLALTLMISSADNLSHLRANEYGSRISVRVLQVCFDQNARLILLYRCTMISLLVRLATKLRLHRDPAELGYLPSESEDRRRLWWNIVELDVSEY